MGNNSPKPAEYNGVYCFVCGVYLPPCKRRKDYHDEYINRVVDVVYCHVFLDYAYYRPTHAPGEYYCPTCFYKPREEYYRQQAEENRRREEQRRREEAERIQREEQQRQYEEQMRQEMLRREEEARRERERQEQLRREAERREAERLRRQQEQQKFEESMAEKEDVADKFASWRRSRREQRQQRVQKAEPYNNMSALPHADALVDYEALHLYDQDFELWSEEDLYGIEEDEGKYDFGEEYTEEQIVSTITAAILAYNPKEGEEIDVAWLKVAQTQLICNYAEIYDLNNSEVEVLTYFVSEVRYNLSDEEILILSKILCLLAQTHPFDYEKTQTTLDDELPGRFMIMLLLTARDNGYQSSQCAINCVETLASAVIKDEDLVTMIKEAKFKDWNAFDRYTFIKNSDEMNLSYTDQKKIMVLIQAYDISPIVVDKAMAKRYVTEIVESLIDYIENEPSTHLVDLLKEIRSTKLIEDETLDKVEDITKKTKKILKSFNIHLDYEQRLTGDLVNSKDIFKQCGSGNTLNHDQLASALTTMCCIIKKSQGYCPRDTQLVTLTILIVSGNTSVSRLLEVMTGEGKSTVIAMFAAILAMQGKHVDIITSSPILALRDAEEWKSFYDILELTATHNTDIDYTKYGRSDESRQELYKKPIIYGTLGNFAADILREEFELKEIRSGRRFDAVIADEVDLLMLDEGVQFTYLSHSSPVLHHLQPVIATVWAVVGQYIPVITTVGHALYMGGAKLFSDIIFESINPEICSVEDSSQFLIIANQAGLIDEQTINKLMFDDGQTSQGRISESKKEAMSTITNDILIALLPKLEEYLPYNFEAYTVNDTGQPEPCYTTEISEAEAALPEDEKLPVIRILLLDNGLACTLNNEEELKDGTTAKIEGSIEFTNQPGSGQNTEGQPKLQVPAFLKELVLNQLPEYIGSAIRCLEMVENREYTISKKNKVIPVDFLNSGVMQLNKKWGQGLQQMLEMKNQLCVSKMSVVTNFMSHVELFTRYRDNGMIYGLSGTLALESPETIKLLKERFEVHPCTIPTFKHRKLFENPAMIVEGGKLDWYAKIMDVINTVVKQETWRNGRAVLVLCEDIKTAIDFKEYVLDQENWSEDKVHLYAHSDSDELKAIKHKFSEGEMVIATNLAGRGTNIKLTDEVNKSGGLLCLVTFLARNRRVELQAFGRTARKGKPGSVQCVLHGSTLAPQYRGHNITEIRKIRAKGEEDRLDMLMNTEVQEVQVKETLFKAHCRFLKAKHQSIHNRNDKDITLDAINENWGQWLLMKSSEIQKLEQEKLTTELTQAHGNWPVINFYHNIKYGNTLVKIDEEDESGLREAHRLYSNGITTEPSLAFIAYHNRAYVTILKADDNYIEAAMADLRKAEECLMPYISEVATIIQCVSFVDKVQPRTSKPISMSVTNEDGDEVSSTSWLSEQMQVRMQILGFVRDKIREAIAKLNEYKDDDVEAEPAGVFSLIPDADYATNLEITALWELGMEVVFAVKKKPRFCWEGLVVILLGVVEIVAGVALAVLTCGAAANIGMGLIAEGISDCIDGVIALATGEFSWAEWGITKAIGLAASLVSGGIAKVVTKGVSKATISIAAKVGKHLKAIPKVAKSTWGIAGKQNFKNVMKHVGKEVVEQGIMRGIGYGQNEILKQLYDKIGEKCKEVIMDDLRQSFTSGYLGEVVQREFILKLPQSYAAEDKMSPALRQRARNFLKEVGQAVVQSLMSDGTIQGYVSEASLSLLSELSRKHQSGKAVYETLELVGMAALVTKAVADVTILLDKLVPETERLCKEFISEEGKSTSGDINKNSHLQCVKALKNELADHMGDVYGDIVSDSLQQNLGFVANRRIHTGVNKYGHKAVSKLLRSSKTANIVKAGQRANYIRSMDPVDYGGLPDIGRSVMQGYARNVKDVTKAGSIVEMKIAAEHYKQGVTIYQEKNGKFVKHSTVDSSTGDPNLRNIKLLYTPSKNKDEPGHYDLIVNNKIVKIESDDSNCLFQAYATGRKPHLADNPQGLDALKAEALNVRKAVADEINKNPQLWAEHVKHRLELKKLRTGERYALLGETGTKNLTTRICQDTYDDFIHKNKRHTLYTQVNGVSVVAVRTYGKKLAEDANGYLMSADGSPEPRMTSMITTLKGMNLVNNVGRCYHTLPVSGMPKRNGGQAKDSCVSYHIGPSEAGGNAGNAYGNAIMTSTDLNKKERDVWDSTMKKSLSNSDFTVEAKVMFEPLIPRNFSKFFKDLNTQRVSEGKLEIDPSNEGALKKRFQAMLAIDNRAVRVKKIEYEITNNVTGKVDNETLGRDYELFVPELFTTAGQTYQLPGENLAASRPKIKRDRINRVPGRKAAKASAAVKRQHDLDVDAHRLANT